MALSDISAPVVVAASTDEASYVDWPAIFAGTLLAMAISFILLTFGSAIGLSMTSAYQGTGISLTAFAIVTALWLVWVQVSGFFAGGYLSGRMRRRHYDATEHESDVRDGSHGITVWALGLILGAALAISGAGSVISTVSSAASTVMSGAAAGAAGSVDSLADANGLMVDRLLRGGTPSANQPSAADTRGEVSRILVSSLGSDALDPADRQYLVDTVAVRTGVDAATAEQRVDQMWAQVQQAEATARAAAERARKIGVILAFITAASLLISAAAAYAGAVLGGNHRDKKIVVEGWSRPW